MNVTETRQMARICGAEFESFIFCQIQNFLSSRFILVLVQIVLNMTFQLEILFTYISLLMP